MPTERREVEGAVGRDSGTAKTTALQDIDLTDLGLEILVEIQLSDGEVSLEEAVREATERALQRAADDPASVDLTTLSLDQLLALSVGGEPAEQEQEPEEEPETADNGAEGENDAPPAADQDPSDGQAAEDPAAGGGSHFPLPELYLESPDLLVGDGERSPQTAGAFLAGLARERPGLHFSHRPVGPDTGDHIVPPALIGPVPGPTPREPFSQMRVGLLDGTVPENWSVGDAVASITVDAADPTGNAAPIAYVLLDNAGGRFVLEDETGVVHIAEGAALAFASAREHPITVLVTAGNQAVEKTFTIHVSPDDRDADGTSGDQVLTGANGASDDVLFGGPGDDRISGLDGGDTLYGGSGADRLFGGNQNDQLYGGSGADVLFGDNHDDFLHGGTGADLLFGGAHDDILHGGGGEDVLHGGAHDDILHGEGGADWLDGGAGHDRLLGGAGDDRLVWDAEDTLVDGGDGEDRLVVQRGDANLAAFTGDLRGIESVDLSADPGGNVLTLTAADVLDITDTGLLAVLGDGEDRVAAGPGWTPHAIDDAGRQLYVQSIGDDLAGLLLDPGVHLLAPADGGGP